MQTVLIVVHLIIVIGLVGVVLLQRSEGGGLGMGGGGSGGVSGFMTGRGQANALTRATAILAGLFFLTSITLSVIASQGRAQRSLIDGATTGGPATGAPATPAVPTPGQGGVLDQLRQLQDAAPQRPATPAPSTPAPVN
jgi:preprotein translocase subunit SecG